MRRKPPLINKQTTGGSLVADIDDLGDVAITSAANGDLLQFDGSNWVNITEADLTITESQISDLDHYDDTDANAAIDARVTQAFVQALSFYTEAEVDAAIAAGAVTDHGALDGLGDNDHPQYARLASNDTVSGQWDFSNQVTLSNGNFISWRDTGGDQRLMLWFTDGEEFRVGNNGYPTVIRGSTVTVPEATVTAHQSAIHHGALTGLSDNDHPQYARIATNETITGNWTFEVDNIDQFRIKRDSTTGATGMGFSNNDGTKGLIGFTDAEVFNIWNSSVSSVLTVDGSGNLDADGDISGATIGGITEANLLDKTAVEVISGIYTFTNNAGLRLAAAGPQFRMSATGATTNNKDWLWLLSGTGSLSATIYSEGFSAPQTTWMRVNRDQSNVDLIQFNGGDEVELNATLLDFNGVADFSSVIRSATGSVGAPTYSFSDDTNTGMYRTGSDVLGFTTGGVLRAQLYNNFFRTQGGMTLAIQEKAAANPDVATYGQIWVRSDTPNTLWFTDDAGNDHHVAGGQLTENIGVVKTADEGVINSSTYQDDDHLVLDVVAGFTYQIRGTLRVVCNSTTPNFRFRMVVPGGSTGDSRVEAWVGSAGSPGYEAAGYTPTSDAYSSIPVNNSTTVPTVVRFWGTLTAGATGTIQIQWAQSTAVIATTTTVKAGSNLSLIRV